MADFEIHIPQLQEIAARQAEIARAYTDYMALPGMSDPDDIAISWQTTSAECYRLARKKLGLE